MLRNKCSRKNNNVVEQAKLGYMLWKTNITQIFKSDDVQALHTLIIDMHLDINNCYIPPYGAFLELAALTPQSTKITGYLLSQPKIEVNEFQSKLNIIDLAMGEGNLEFAKTLIAHHKFNVNNYSNVDNLSSFTSAIINGAPPSFLDLLVANNADPYLGGDGNGQTAYGFANYFAKISYLLSNFKDGHISIASHYLLQLINSGKIRSPSQEDKNASEKLEVYFTSIIQEQAAETIQYAWMHYKANANKNNKATPSLTKVNFSCIHT